MNRLCLLLCLISSVARAGVYTPYNTVTLIATNEAKEPLDYVASSFVGHFTIGDISFTTSTLSSPTEIVYTPDNSGSFNWHNLESELVTSTSSQITLQDSTISNEVTASNILTVATQAKNKMLVRLDFTSGVYSSVITPIDTRLSKYQSLFATAILKFIFQEIPNLSLHAVPEPDTVALTAVVFVLGSFVSLAVWRNRRLL